VIRSDDDLRVAQECIANLERVLLEARKTHTAAQYALLSKPLLLDLQARQSEIVAYLMETEVPQTAAS
jgi:hypothetical protein